MSSLPGTPSMTDPADPVEPASAERPAKARINWWHEIRGLALMLLGVLAFHTAVAKPFYIPSSSMMPNLLIGDRLVVSKYPYGWSWVSVSAPFHVLSRSDWRIAPKTPAYGDIVIVVPPDTTEDYIKRVVALPGDRIAVVGGQIVLNGKPVPQTVEPDIQLPVDKHVCNGRPCLEEFDSYRRTLPDGREVYELPALRETLPNGATYTIIDHMQQRLDNFPETLVPAGHVFLMGDNRDHSADSRAQAGFDKGLGGPVPLSDVGGRAEFLTFSFDGSATLNPLTWWGALRDGRAWESLRPRHMPQPAGAN